MCRNRLVKVFEMSEGNDSKRMIKFTDDNVAFYEAQFMLEHNRAMGYVARPEPVQPPQLL